MLFHEAGHALAARACRCRVEEFGFGLPPRLAGRRIGETVFSVNLLPVGGFVKLTGEDDHEGADPRSFAAKSRPLRAFMLGSGVLANILLAWILFSILAGTGRDFPREATAAPLADERIDILEVADTPALRAAGLRPRDVLLAVNDRPVAAAADAARAIREFAGPTLRLTVRRGDRPLSLVLRFQPPKEPGARVGLALLDVGTIRVPWSRAPLEGLAMTGRTVVTTWRGIGRLARNLLVERTAPADIAGPVGIAALTGVVAQRGLGALVELTAVLSINLAVINILPIPALDGGRLLFLALDALGLRFLRGRPERLAHTIGFAILLLLLALITVGDIRRLSQ